MCPRLLVALTQTLFVWAVCFMLLDHEDKLFCRWLLSMLNYQVSIFGRCSLQPNKFVGGQFIRVLELIPKIAGYVCKWISPKFVFGYTNLVSLVRFFCGPLKGRTPFRILFSGRMLPKL